MLILTENAWTIVTSNHLPPMATLGFTIFHITGGTVPGKFLISLTVTGH